MRRDAGAERYWCREILVQTDTGAERYWCRQILVQTDTGAEKYHKYGFLLTSFWSVDTQTNFINIDPIFS